MAAGGSGGSRPSGSSSGSHRLDLPDLDPEGGCPGDVRQGAATAGSVGGPGHFEGDGDRHGVVAAAVAYRGSPIDVGAVASTLGGTGCPWHPGPGTGDGLA